MTKKPVPEHDDAPTTVDPQPFAGSAPIQVVSMKTPIDAQRASPPPPVVPRPKLRAISDIAPTAPPTNLGYLAPPRDPAEVRSRRVRDLVMWSSVAVIVACAVALAIWFLAR